MNIGSMPGGGSGNFLSSAISRSAGHRVTRSACSARVVLRAALHTFSLQARLMKQTASRPCSRPFYSGAAPMRALARIALLAAALLGAVMLPGCSAECSADLAPTLEGLAPTPTPTEMAAKCCDAGEPTVCEKPRKGGSGMFWPTPSTDNPVPKWVRESACRGVPSSPAPHARGGASGA